MRAQSDVKSGAWEPFQLGDFRVYPRRNLLVGSRGEVRLEPKVMAVLVALAAAGDGLLTRDELLDQVWPRQVVGERVLTRAVSELRKALGESDERRYIETIVKRGYRLLVDPRPLRRRRRMIWVLVIASLVVLSGGYILRQIIGSDPEGSIESIRPLTSFPAWEYDPALSPDGRQVAFVWKGPDELAWDIYLMDLDGHSPQPLTDSGATYGSPAWREDGRAIAYYRFDPDQRVCTIHWRDLVTGEDYDLGAVNAIYPDVAFSGDDALLFNEERDDGVMAVRRVSLADGSRETITRPAPGIVGDDTAYQFEDTVYFTRTFTEGSQEIFALRDGQEAALTTLDRNIRGHATNASGTWFAAATGGRYQLGRLAAGELHWLGRADGLANPSIGGARIVAERWNSDTNLLSITLDEKITTIVASTKWDMSPALSPVDTNPTNQLAFISNRDGFYELWLAYTDGQHARQLTRFQGPYVAGPAFSVDGSSVLFEVRDGGQSDLYSVRIESGQVTRLTDTPYDEVAAADTADGIMYASNRGGQWELWLGLGDNANQLTHGGARSGQMVGDDLYFSHPRRPGIFRLRNGDTSRVIDTLDPTDWGNWTIVNGEVGYEAIFLVRSSNNRDNKIVARSLDSGDERVIANLGRVPYFDPALAANPKQVIIAVTETSHADLTVLEVQ